MNYAKTIHQSSVLKMRGLKHQALGEIQAAHDLRSQVVELENQAANLPFGPPGSDAQQRHLTEAQGFAGKVQHMNDSELAPKPSKTPKAKLTTRPAAEEDFLSEMTRKLLVDWCHHSTITGSLPWAANPNIHPPQPYVDFAKAKGWLSKDGSKILTPGWKTAAAYLRR